MRTSFRRWLAAGLLPLIGLAVGCSSRGMDLNQSSTQMNFGVKAAEMDLWREARFRFERAVQLDPNDSMALNNLAVAYEGSGEFEKARETYVRALKIDQSNQYIQKNYSRFMEFYSRNRKRDASAAKVAPAGASVSPSPLAQPATPAGAPPMAAPTPVPVPAPTPKEAPMVPAVPASTPTGGR